MEEGGGHGILPTAGVFAMRGEGVGQGKNTSNDRGASKKCKGKNLKSP